MNPLHLVPPLFALAIAGGLVGVQRQKIFRLEKESIVLSQHIADQKNAADRQDTAADPMRPMKPENSDDGIDWAELAESMDGMRNGGGSQDMRKMMSLHTKLQKMNKEQIIAALDEIHALELDDEQRLMLESMLISPLVSKDPELALTYFRDRIGDNGSMNWQLSNALGEWAKKDPAAATLWFDKEIASGTFDSTSLDGSSRSRVAFESNLILRLISADPAAAGARIAALPLDQRMNVLTGYSLTRIKEKDQAAYANLVRSQLSEVQQLKALGDYAAKIAMKGELEDVGGFLDSIGSTAEERVKLAEQAASGSLSLRAHQAQVTVEKIDSMREWLGTQAPGSVERVTGETLGEIALWNNDTKFSEAMEMALKYHDQGGGDDVLTGFLNKAGNHQNKEELRQIAEKISDPKKREQALKNLN
ncbi:MAG: hypothetical protein ABJQ29_02145 [Luteolibacter sp.]